MKNLIITNNNTEEEYNTELSFSVSQNESFEKIRIFYEAELQLGEILTGDGKTIWKMNLCPDKQQILSEAISKAFSELNEPHAISHDIEPNDFISRLPNE